MGKPRKRQGLTAQIHDLPLEVRRKEAARLLAEGMLRLLAQKEQPSTEEKQTA